MLRHDGDKSIHFCLCNGPISSAAVAAEDIGGHKETGLGLRVIGQEMLFIFLGKVSFTAWIFYILTMNFNLTVTLGQ